VCFMTFTFTRPTRVTYWAKATAIMFEAKYMFIVLILCQFNFSLALVERNIRISGEQFILTKTNEPIVMIGPNVVVKGNPLYNLFIYATVAILF
jgi:hypothetical protein